MKKKKRSISNKYLLHSAFETDAWSERNEQFRKIETYTIAQNTWIQKQHTYNKFTEQQSVEVHSHTRAETHM